MKRHTCCIECLEGRSLFASYAAATVTELIAAMNAANASAGADTISLGPRGTFTLTAQHNTSNGGNGLPQVTDGRGLTIIGGAATSRAARQSARSRSACSTLPPARP